MGTDQEPIAEALDGLMAFINDLDHQLVRLLEAHPLPEGLPGTSPSAAEPVAPVLLRIRGQRQRLAQVEALAERHVAHAVGTGKKTVAGLPIDVHGGWERKDWQDREIARLLAENALVNPETGELDQRLLQVAMLAVYRVIEAGRMSWRVTDLKAAGLNPDEGLCKREPKRMTVQFLTPAETR